jgi:hypothetical protein
MSEQLPETGPHSASLRATFDTPEDMQRAIDDLAISGFDRADITVIHGGDPMAETIDEADTAAPYNEEDARQARTLHASGAASVAALAGAGITVATGGLAVAAVAVAVAAGAAAGAITHAVSTAANTAEQAEREITAAAGHLAISVQVPTAEKEAKAQAILHTAGATDIILV